MTPKELVKSFYDSDLANDSEVVSTYFHKDVKLHWNSTAGYNVLDYKTMDVFFKEINTSYNSLRLKISHLLQDGQNVTVRYSTFVKTIEDPENEQPLSHFIVIWEVKDEKLYLGFAISQLADENLESDKSFSQIKV